MALATAGSGLAWRLSLPFSSLSLFEGDGDGDFYAFKHFHYKNCIGGQVFRCH